MTPSSRVPLSGDRVPIGALQPVAKRMTFVYLERCVVHRDANAIAAMDESGTTFLPAASFGVLLLGPGTRITHQAMVLLGESGVVASWVGEGGTRLYASAPSLSRSTRLLEAQARLVSNRRSRLAVARAMYQMRFPGEDVTRATMQQLRGMEGARIRRAYRALAEQYGTQWSGRRYDPADSSAGDLVNRALSVANSALYGIAHTVIAATGCSPGLGFVHTGHSLSFVYDVADLYKVEISFPAAFESATRGKSDFHGDVRRQVRERAHANRLLERIVDDLHRLLGQGSDVQEGDATLSLYDETVGGVPAGTDYGATT